MSLGCEQQMRNGGKQMKLILFGAGITGDEALSCFGGNNVHCFCDNSVTDGNTGEKAGLKIISFQGLTRIHG